MEERSAGAVLFSDGELGRRFILLRYPAGHWDFPKGNVERGETEVDAAVREVREETGLDDIKIIGNFRRKIAYFYRHGSEGIHKEVVFLLAKTDKESVRLSFEHEDYGWFRYRDAIARLTYDNSRQTLTAAQKYLHDSGL